MCTKSKQKFSCIVFMEQLITAFNIGHFKEVLGGTYDGVMAYFVMQCLPLTLSSKPQAEGTEWTLAAQAKQSAPVGRAELFVPGGSIYDGVHLYQVQSILGEGTFGKVAKCMRMADKKIVAIKMIKKRGSCADAQKEVALPRPPLSQPSCQTLTFLRQLWSCGQANLSICTSSGSSPVQAERSGPGQMQYCPLAQTLYRSWVHLPGI